MKDTNKNPFWIAVGDRLRELRESNHETQSELGEAIGESRSLVNMWESGDRAIKAEALLAISNHYNCTLDYLLCKPGAAMTPAYDMQAACNVTGLDQKAIKMLLQMDRNVVLILEKLLLCHDFFILLNWAADYDEMFSSMLDDLHSIDVSSFKTSKEHAEARFDLLDMKDRIDLSKYKLQK